MRPSGKASSQSMEVLNVSHFSFVYDIILFSKIIKDGITNNKMVIMNFCSTSGQKANFNKSQMLICKSSFESFCNKVSHQSGVNRMGRNVLYLGMSHPFGKNRKDDFSIFNL